MKHLTVCSKISNLLRLISFSFKFQTRSQIGGPTMSLVSQFITVLPLCFKVHTLGSSESNILRAFQTNFQHKILGFVLDLRCGVWNTKGSL